MRPVWPLAVCLARCLVASRRYEKQLNQKRLCVDLVHEDEQDSMGRFAPYRTGNPCAPELPSAHLPPQAPS
jgi:hypothetical protein